MTCSAEGWAGIGAMWTESVEGGASGGVSGEGHRGIRALVQRRGIGAVVEAISVPSGVNFSHRIALCRVLLTPFVYPRDFGLGKISYAAVLGRTLSF